MSTRFTPIPRHAPAVACVYTPNLADLQRAVRQRGFNGLDERERAAVLALPWEEFDQLVRTASSSRRTP